MWRAPRPKSGAGVVFFSTDYVFGGEDRPRHDPHTESSLPDPYNVYGVSKLAGERMVMNANPRHLVIRSAGSLRHGDEPQGLDVPGADGLQRPQRRLGQGRHRPGPVPDVHRGPGGDDEGADGDGGAAVSFT